MPTGTLAGQHPGHKASARGEFHSRRYLPLFLAAAWYLTGPGLSRAELYVGGYLGASMSEYHDVRLTDQLAPGGVQLRMKEVKYEASFSRGGKLGYWLGPLPSVGIEVDGYHYNPVIVAQSRLSQGTLRGRIVPGETKVAIGDVSGVDRATVKVEGIGFLLMGRLRLSPSARFPNGRVQPYGGAGPALFLQEFQFKPVSNQKVNDLRLGVQALGGMRFFLHRNVALFAEYKFSHVDVSLTYDGFGGRAKSTRFESAISTHHLSGGVALHFDLF